MGDVLERRVQTWIPPIFDGRLGAIDDKSCMTLRVAFQSDMSPFNPNGKGCPWVCKRGGSS